MKRVYVETYITFMIKNIVIKTYAFIVFFLFWHGFRTQNSGGKYSLITSFVKIFVLNLFSNKRLGHFSTNKNSKEQYIDEEY